MELCGWVGSCGRVVDVELWEQLLSELDDPNLGIMWIRVPSHGGQAR